MSAAPATKGRRIGEIVLELGFASEADVAKATLEHEKTGQPLGQILVELGTITRLELASALAEQWSDQSASIKLLPIPHPVMAADEDLNRGISTAEWDRAAASRFNLLDAAHDGRLTLAELAAERMRMFGERRGARRARRRGAPERPDIE